MLPCPYTMATDATQQVWDSVAALNSTITDHVASVVPKSLHDISSMQVVFTVLALAVSLLAMEQVVYRVKKGGLPGPAWSIPLIGKFADSLHPTLEKYQEAWNSGSLSATSVFNIFIVIASSTEYTRKILNSPMHAEPCLVASAKKVLCHDNWVFLNGKAHVDYRKGLNTLFTSRALGIYLPIQEAIYKKHFHLWTASPKSEAEPFMLPLRHLNLETSLRVFCGSYISEQGAKQISDEYWLITMALELVNFPFALPGTKVYRAIQARKNAMKWFEHTAAESKKRMALGEEVTCLTDAWIRAMIDAREDRNNEDLGAEQRRVLVRDFSNREIGMVLLSFLFASQDAMSSGLTYLFQHLADHPEILRKVREEQYAIRNNDVEAPVTMDTVEKMTYTRAVVKESLRLKPPVLMVPYLARQAFPISKDYTAPKGSMVIPSFWNSLHDPAAYPSPDEFLPERWLEGPDSPAAKNPKNYLVFGNGPHNCIGKEYAMQHLVTVIGAASVLMNWEHKRTDLSEKVMIIATIYPTDGACLKFSRRPAPPMDAPAAVAAAM